MTQPTVTDEDREAAANLKQLHSDSYSTELIRQGRMDDGDYVQAFAAQRLLGQRQGIEAKGWQDIATAPKDESVWIILWNGAEVVPGSRYESGWCDCFYDWMDPQPTRWQRLPAAPEAVGQ